MGSGDKQAIVGQLMVKCQWAKMGKGRRDTVLPMEGEGYIGRRLYRKNRNRDLMSAGRKERVIVLNPEERIEGFNNKR